MQLWHTPPEERLNERRAGHGQKISGPDVRTQAVLRVPARTPGAPTAELKRSLRRRMARVIATY